MSAQDNIKLVRQLFDVYNQNNLNKLNAFDDYMAPNVKFQDPVVPNAKLGTESIKQAEKKYVTAFPNKKTTIDDIFATEDRVAVQWTTTGTQKGEFEGHHASNRDFKIRGISLYRISHGKITEVNQVWDREGILAQTGSSKQTTQSAR